MQLFLLLFLIHKSDKWTPIGAEFQTGKCRTRLRPLGTVCVHVSVSETSRMLRLESKKSVLWVPLSPPGPGKALFAAVVIVLSH